MRRQRLRDIRKSNLPFGPDRSYVTTNEDLYKVSGGPTEQSRNDEVYKEIKSQKPHFSLGLQRPTYETSMRDLKKPTQSFYNDAKPDKVRAQAAQQKKHNFRMGYDPSTQGNFDGNTIKVSTPTFANCSRCAGKRPRQG